MSRRRFGMFLAGGIVAALAAVLASTAAAAPGRVSAKAASGPQPITAAAWRKLVAQAKQEGQVTIYSVQSPTALAAAAAAFKQQYGITVNVNRAVDSVLVAQIGAEESSGKAIADIWVPSPKRYVVGAVQNHWVVDAVGPNFFNKRFDRSTYMVSKAWIVGSAVLGFAWNTQAVKTTPKSPGDFLTSVFDGKIGVPDPRISPSFMDWYLWAESKWGGVGFLQKLAALHPKIYTSTLPMTQAVASGEIIGAPCAAGTALDLKAAGAPIDYKVLPDNWNAPYYGMILKQAPHPAAAQLFANFLISPQGQGFVDHGFGADYPNIDGTFYAKPRIVKLNDFTTAKVNAFNAQWVSLFVH